MDLAGFDEVGVELLQVSEGFACCELWELGRWVRRWWSCGLVDGGVH